MSYDLVRRLALALQGLALSPAPCWRAHGVGNPMVSRHSDACVAAREALQAARLFLPNTTLVCGSCKQHQVR